MGVGHRGLGIGGACVLRNNAPLWRRSTSRGILYPFPVGVQFLNPLYEENPMATPRKYPWIAALGAGALAVAAFHPRPAPAPKPAHPVVVTASDYAFQAPDTIAAGLTEFRLHNLGPSLHHLTLVRLGEGKTLEDLVKAMAPNAPMPVWAVLAGGPNASVPGGWSSATVVLSPGRYVMLCFVPDSANVPHFAHGMMKEFLVTGTGRGALPKGDLSVSLVDYAFKWSKAPMAGKQVWVVTNGAAQPHEMLVAQLAPGKTASDLVAWVDGGMRGPPPGAPVGGLSPLAPGGSNAVALDLTPGSYVLICFLPDVKDGKDHASHGMMQTFVVSGEK